MKDINEIVNKIIQGNSLQVLKEIPDETVSCVVTSPPYWSLRAYETEPQIWDGDPNCQHEWETERTSRPNSSGGRTDYLKVKNKENYSEFTDYNDRATYSDFCKKCGAWRGELGLEPHYDFFVKHLCDIFNEVKRVLRKDGAIYVNLGDTYSGSGNGQSEDWDEDWILNSKNLTYKCDRGVKQKQKILPAKSLIGVPFRFAIEMLNRGWILRNVIIWQKPNCLPESIKDRNTKDFEYIFFFVKSNKYYHEQLFEPMQDATFIRSQYSLGGNKGGTERDMIGHPDGIKIPDPRGRNKRCVWQIHNKSLHEDHYAAYPEELVALPIKASCPEWICQKCNKPWIRFFDKKKYEEDYKQNRQKSIADYTEIIKCDCGEITKPGIVLDPFAGTGTTCLVSDKLQRRWIGIELQPKYISIIHKRIENEGNSLFRTT